MPAIVWRLLALRKWHHGSSASDRKWSLTCPLPVFVISNQASEWSRGKDIHTTHLCQTQHLCMGVTY